MTATKELMPTNLQHIQDGQFDLSLLDQHCVDWKVGPVKISACVDPSVPSASVNVEVAGTSIGRCVLSPSHQDCKIGGSVGFAKAEATFQLKNKCLVVELEVCIFGACKKYQHELYCF